MIEGISLPTYFFQLVLARKMSFYIVTYYLPSGLFVVVSWISFLVNPEVSGEPSKFWGPCISGWNSPHTVFNLVPTMKGDSWTNDAAHHHLPRAHQHLQHHPDKFAAGSRVWRKSVSLQLVPGWRPDSNGGLGDRLHRLCLRRSHGVRCPFLLSLNEYLVNLGPYLCNFSNLRLSLIRYTAILFKMKLRKLYGAKRKKDNYAMTDLTFLVVFPILFLAFNVLYWTGVYWTRTF